MCSNTVLQPASIDHAPYINLSALYFQKTAIHNCMNDGTWFQTLYINEPLHAILLTSLLQHGFIDINIIY